MASTRRKDPAPFNLFTDVAEGSEDWQLARTLQNYNAAQEASMTDITNSNIILKPPTSQTSLSPLKHPSPTSSPPLQITSAFFDSIVLPPPEESVQTDSLTKKDGNFGPYFPQAAPRPQKALFATFPAINGPAEKENRASSALPSDGALHDSQPFGGFAPVLGKRPTPEPSAIRNRPQKKPKVEEDYNGPIPEPEDMPVVIDEGGKPPYSYSQLIGMAILRSSGRKMTLAHIYKWICDTFEFYREAGPGWQNSIRHNLSLNKSFVKMERPKDDPGKGHYWALTEGSELQFVKDKSLRRPTTTEQHFYAPYYDPTTGDSFKGSQGPPLSTSAFKLPPQSRRALDSSQFPGDSELSSDATVLASDDDKQNEDEFAALPLPPRKHVSPPPSPQMHSSPPVAHTPSRHQRFVSHSRSGSRAKQQDTFKDSGFYSSIESSIPRGKPAGVLPIGSEAEHRSSALRRGRAEEEIARMRSSSFDPSPSKPKQVVFKKPALIPTTDSSSPLRPSQLGFPPLTPGIMLLPPVKAPPTVSPGTHLRWHRESVRDLVGTPARGLLPPEDKKWSPLSFHSEPELSPMKPTDDEFAILDDEIDFEAESAAIEHPRLLLDGTPSLHFDNPFDDDGLHTDSEKWTAFFSSGSPIAKKSSTATRPGLQRSNTSTDALTGVFGGGVRDNARLASPFRMPSPPSKQNASRSISPIKRPADAALKADAFWGAESSPPSHDENDENAYAGHGSKPKAALDLFKGFRSIGSGLAGVGKENEAVAKRQGKPLETVKTKKSSRPPLGRSSTNVW